MSWYASRYVLDLAEELVDLFVVLNIYLDYFGRRSSTEASAYAVPACGIKGFDDLTA